jgi:hypothetical protein
MEKTQEKTLEQWKEEYIQSLTPLERKGYEIAKDHLAGIFYLEETNGFLQWKKKMTSASSAAGSSSQK